MKALELLTSACATFLIILLISGVRGVYELKKKELLNKKP